MPSFTECPHCGRVFQDSSFDALAAELVETHARIRELESAARSDDGSKWVDVEGALERVPEG